MLSGMGVLDLGDKIVVKMKGNDGMSVYVVLHGNQWAVKTDNSERAYKVFDTQAEATKCGIEVAKNNHAELRIQDRDGKFRRCNSYGNDPRSVKDKNL